jgi:DNA-binding transcriptional LysR family regulator
MKIRDLTLWESFYWVAKEGSFVRAAKKLNVGAPLLSKRVARLEEELGVRLFQRSTRQVGLTQEGRGLLPRIESFLGDAQGLEDQFSRQSEVAGVIRMTCVTAFAHRVLAPLLVEFCALYPAVKFELEVTDAFVDLIDAQMDLAIRVQEPTGADFIFKKLLQNKLILCASPVYLKRHGSKLLKPQDLQAHRVLMLGVYGGSRFKGCPLALRDLANAQTIRSESGLFLTELACQGAGVAVRSVWDVHPLLESGRLVQVLKPYALDPFGDMYLVIPSRRLLAHRIRVFIDFIMEKAKRWKF